MQKYYECIEVTTTVESREDADVLAKCILEKRLAACVQIVSCRSSYHWQRKIEQADEYKMYIKTFAEHYPRLEGYILKHHPYETPEIFALPVLRCSKDYLAWMAKELKIS